MLLVTEMLGHLRFERRLEHPLGEPVQQTIRAVQVDALFLRLLQQLLRELLFIDDLSRQETSRLGSTNDAVHFGADQSYELRHAIVGEAGDIPSCSQTVRFARAPDKELDARIVTCGVTDSSRR